MATGFVVVDMRALLDDSRVGREAARTLEQRWTDSVAKAQSMREKAKAAPGTQKTALMEQVQKFERETEQALEEARNTLRREVLARAQPFEKEAAQARGVTAVLDRASVVLCEKADDLTDEVIDRIDALGPLKV